MTVWEYLVKENQPSGYQSNPMYESAPLQDFLNAMGKDRWEAFDIRFLGTDINGLRPNFLIIAKRPVEEIPVRPNPKWFKREQIVKAEPQPHASSNSATPIASNPDDEKSPRKDMILELRRLTGASVTRCFQALEQTSGDLDAAQQIIQKDSFS